ncbi:MAG: DNA polymerase III subunit delta, partial [Gammaproteobacteria bacterium]|nr:DNA polymerase III subunit delta [Gammaproteobacteria bacterium]
MKLGLDTLATHLQGGRLAPAYLVSGDEALLVGEAVDALRHTARQQGYT